MNLRDFAVLSRPALLAGIAAAALAACSGGSSLPGQPAAPVAPALAIDAGTAKLTVSPTKLNFTTVPALKITISESKYTGTFKLTVTPSTLVKLSSKAPKGPKAKVTVTALNAGTGTLTVADKNGQTKSVPLSVTQGVIIIQ